MKTLKIIALVAISATLSFLACKKETSNTQGNFTSIGNAFSSIAPTPQSFTVDAVNGGSFYCRQGTRMVVPMNAFRTSTGSPVTSGTVTLRVKELLTKSDMMLSGVLPMSNGILLESGGQFSIFASNANGNLNIAPGKQIEMNVPQGGTLSPGMETFFSNQSENATNVNWGRDSSASSLIYNGDTIRLLVDSCRWVNVDKYATLGTPVNFKLNVTGTTLPSTIDANSAASYISMDNKKMCGGLNVTNPSSPTISIHLVLAFIKGGKFFAGISPAIIPVSNSTYTINVSEITPEAFKLMIDNLP